MDNILYYGDNLDILQRYIDDESVDLIYLDPPFKSNQNYNVLFEEQNGSHSKAQIKAFEDTWRWDRGAEEAYQEMVMDGAKTSEVLQSFRGFLGENDMMAYLAYMAPRLKKLRRVLKETGSIYLHCDPTASHYLKILMDAVFGHNHFQNEIIWSYKRYTAISNRFQRLHDIILFYSKSNDTKFHSLRDPYGDKSGKADSHYKQDADGRWYRYQKRKGKEPYIIYLSEGKRMGDVWDIPTLNASAKERLGYPTQKPEALLERIINAGSNEGDVILDPFCGCGTAVSVAQHFNRKWIGIDITHLAITLIKSRLKDTYNINMGRDYKVIGEPVSLTDAIKLSRQDRYQFQWWALGLVGARPVEEKKGADKGIDGRIYFFDDPNSGKAEQIIFSVKSGGVTSSQVRDLRGVIERENAVIGVFITLEAPSYKMKTEAATAGIFRSVMWGEFPRLQILTIEEILNGKKIEYPPSRQTDKTFKKAARAKEKPKIQKEIDLK